MHITTHRDFGNLFRNIGISRVTVWWNNYDWDTYNSQTVPGYFSNNRNLLPSTFCIYLYFWVKPSGLGAWIFSLSHDLLLKYFGCWGACSFYQAISYTEENIVTYPYHRNQWHCYLMMRLLGFRCLLRCISYILGWCFYSTWRRVFCQIFTSPYLQKRKNYGYIFSSGSL